MTLLTGFVVSGHICHFKHWFLISSNVSGNTSWVYNNIEFMLKKINVSLKKKKNYLHSDSNDFVCYLNFSNSRKAFSILNNGYSWPNLVNRVHYAISLLLIAWF